MDFNGDLKVFSAIRCNFVYDTFYKSHFMPKKPPDLFKFWNELKRRKVVKASLVYLAVAFAILQAADIIFPRLGLPDWTVTFILILMIILFILVIVLTWVYDITPEGIKVTQDLKSKPAEGKKQKQGKESGLQKTDKSTGPGADEIYLQKKVIALEDQLKEARKASLRSLWPVFFKKIVVPVLIAALLLVMVLNKQRIVELMGFGNAKRELAMKYNANGVMYMADQDFDAARRELALAIENDPDYSYAWGNIAVVSYMQGDLDKAINQTIKAIGLDPKNSKAPYNLAFALDDKKDYKQAVRWYREAIRIDSVNNADSVYTAASSALGRMYNTFGQPIDAIIILNRARKTFPESKYICYVYKNLGNAYLLQEQTDSALKYLELSNGLQPSVPETNLFMARAYEAAGQMNKSIEQWQKYIDLESDTVKINAAIKHRKELAVRQLQEIIK
jgi:tetratricopeptide (TPR) repeat protein